MAEILIFHHIQGLTDGVLSFADDLRSAGHTVHTPDLFGGSTFPDIPSGQAHVERIGFDAETNRLELAIEHYDPKFFTRDFPVAEALFAPTPLEIQPFGCEPKMLP